MKGTSTRPHTVLAVSVSTALVLLTAGCSQDVHTGAAATAPAVSAAAPGQVSVRTSGADLTITDAVAHLDRSGDGTLSMTVRNDDGVPEHLGMVATPDSGRGVLVGGKAANGNGSLATAGILLLSGTSVTFGGHGPRVLLHHVHGMTAEHTLPLALQFGVAGLVHFQARVASS
ncbi:hypothetical protein LK08_18070 [Streptomyces sp. MUSC 125]|uniref:hypothetical protein n=1 Tax=Streptomyces sp. MUSC 125 TaxID=1428624 RepID=UPI0005801B51|nr:hypothetical protein [Streptomyces sp. MUSC 125]KIE25629.1 hypothetical protein LK08_18070 [Streptomyces sp. MUSC 125]